MALAARKFERSMDVPVVENGIVRTTIFPNNLREIRRKKGYESLQDFTAAFDFGKLTYTRVAKIERGQVIPRSSEVIDLAKALKVDPIELFIDFTDDSFDSEQWARENVEAKLKFRGGDRDDMRIGAAMRLRRLSLKLSTTALDRFGMPSATASRIENAERPIERWDLRTHKSMYRLFGARSMKSVLAMVDEYDEAGKLAPMMYELFSLESLELRQNSQVAGLLKDIPGKKARDLQAKLQQKVEESKSRAGSQDAKAALRIAENATDDRDVFELGQSAEALVVYEGETVSGVTRLSPSKDKVERKSGKACFAMRLDKSVLGLGLPANAMLVFEEIERADIEDGMVIALINGFSARVVHARAAGRGYRLQQIDPEWKSTLSVEPSQKVAKMVQVELN